MPKPLDKWLIETLLSVSTNYNHYKTSSGEKLIFVRRDGFDSRQPNTDESIARLKECTKCHFNAPTAMLVCHNKDESWVRKYDGALSSPVDAVIVTTHLMLACQNEGVGSCWVMHFNPAAMRETFNIPDNIEPVALLVMGYPSDDAKPLDLHFKSRPIDETVFYDCFR